MHGTHQNSGYEEQKLHASISNVIHTCENLSEKGIVLSSSIPWSVKFCYVDTAKLQNSGSLPALEFYTQGIFGQRWPTLMWSFEWQVLSGHVLQGL